MTKNEFLDILQAELSGLKFDERQKTLQYYSEMIDDRMEDGVSEEDAVESLGSLEDIVSEILKETPDADTKPEKKRISALTIILFVCALPILLVIFSLAIVAVACLAVAIACLGVIPIALGASALGCLVGGILQFVLGRIIVGLAAIGASSVCAGLFILTLKPTILLCRETVMLIPKLIKFIIKKCKKGGAMQ